MGNIGWAGSYNMLFDPADGELLAIEKVTVNVEGVGLLGDLHGPLVG